MPSGNVNTDGTNLGPKIAAQTHDLYTLFKPTWVQLAHVREGTGGFLATDNSSYLVAHPREWLDHSTVQVDADGNKKTAINPRPTKPSPKLIARRKLASYENVASAIIEAKKSSLFREQPSRRVGQEQKKGDGDKEPTELEQWWENVDGAECHIDDAMPAWWDMGGTFGHIVLYFDIAESQSGAQTAADDAWPYVRVYTPLDVLDWRRDDDGKLVWIKLLEAVQSQPDGELPSITTYRIRIVDETSWTLYDYKTGKYLNTGEHKLGRLPVVFFYGKRRAILTDIGESVLGDPRNYIDLFNLESEKRELLRGQTFSFINLPLGNGPDAMSVEAAQAMMGSQTGTMNVLFSGLQAQMLSGDAANVEAYQESINSKKREIYRETGVQWETDSKDAEATGSLELKREEMNTRLSAYADECQKTEYELAELWYRWRYGADGWEAKYDADQVTIHYPERFSATPFEEVLNQVEAAQAIGMPAAFLKALRKAIVTKFEGMSNLTLEQLKEITDAIDNAPDDPTPAERMKQKMDILAAATKGGVKPPAGAGNLEAA